MELAFASSSSLPNGRRGIYNKKLLPPTPCSTRKWATRKTYGCLATVAKVINPATEFEIESKKHQLLRAIQETQRGLVTTADQRSSIEEALVRFPLCSSPFCNSTFVSIRLQNKWQVCVERYDAGAPIDLGRLDGTWRLQYTSAPDVLILLDSAARLPFFEVGQIFQRFECRDQSDGGVVRNVVRWSIPTLLEEQEGATLLVSAKFSVISQRNIYLQFEEVSVQNINISEELQALIVPAILPRTFSSLQFIRSFKAQFPVRSPERQSVGGLYYLSYLDGNMLLGRAVGGGGVFVFSRAQPLIF
ncbi:hypothetical protein HHK36_027336 [Tetracentron sinense]|uniref:Plastid lipid-associated protein/fibrillin conserved domain-containing protein n=1 Tax=Tetracentron sinense TaxID=13715 RepID=A0A835D3G4_TETSI|nr:hypothetical protein HHK36_027336 [Tetracentron sinense]